jgi:hypothetical protein
MHRKYMVNCKDKCELCTDKNVEGIRLILQAKYLQDVTKSMKHLSQYNELKTDPTKYQV